MMMQCHRRSSVLAGLIAASLISPAWAQDAGTPTKETLEQALPKPPYSPYADRNFPTRPFFGDTHLHTSFSMDAGAFGARLGAARCLSLRAGRGGHRLHRPAGEALAPARLPRGRRSLRQHGLLPRPLRGQARDARRPDRPQVVRHDPVRQGRARPRSRSSSPSRTARSRRTSCTSRARAPTAARGRRRSPPPSSTTSRAASPPSSATSGPRTPAATTCIATSSSATTATRRARSSRSPSIRRYGSDNPVELWKWMDAYEKKTGGSVLAIAHNGNLSNGIDVPRRRGLRQAARPRVRRAAREVGAALRGDADQGRRRGASRSSRRTTSSPTSSSGTRATSTAASPRRRRCSSSSMPARRYKNGLKLEQQLGTNPYKFGLVGSSDAHTGLAAMEEDNFFGKTTPQEPSPHRMTAAFINNAKTGVKIMDWEVGASGYAAVWAHGEHARRPSGTPCSARRPTPPPARAWSCASSAAGISRPGDADNRLPAQIGYTKGVPMGGDLRAAPAGQSAHLPRGRAEGSDRRQPRPLPDHQGLARRERQAAREGLRRRLVRATASRARTASFRRSATPWTSRTRPGPTPSARPS